LEASGGVTPVAVAPPLRALSWLAPIITPASSTAPTTAARKRRCRFAGDAAAAFTTGVGVLSFRDLDPVFVMSCLEHKEPLTASRRLLARTPPWVRPEA
jgi:hypothetical protein